MCVCVCVCVCVCALKTHKGKKNQTGRQHKHKYKIQTSGLNYASLVACPDGRSLLLSPCLVESTEARLLEREDLESRVREVEEENRKIRLQLSQSQGLAAQPPEGNYGNQQWVASADTGPEDVENTAEERANHSDCSRSPTVEKCEVSSFGGCSSVFILDSGNESESYQQCINDVNYGKWKNG